MIWMMADGQTDGQGQAFTDSAAKQCFSSEKIQELKVKYAIPTRGIKQNEN